MSILTNFNKKASLKMQIKCENCSIIYEVPENHLIIRHPKFLKCTSCGHVFQAPHLSETTQEPVSAIPEVEQTDTVPMSLAEIFQTPEPNTEEILPTSLSKSDSLVSDLTEQENMTADLFAPFEKADEFMPISDEGKNKQKRLFYILLFITFLVFALVYFLYIGRYYFVRQVGISPALYKKANIETNITGDGLAFQNSLFDIIKDSNGFILSVKSEVMNTTDSTKDLPPIVILLKDDKGNIIQRTTPLLGKNALNSGEVLPFELSWQLTNQKAQKIEITFEKENK